MTAIAYAASHGDYSGYAVAAIFTTREAADAWVKERNDAIAAGLIHKCTHCDGHGNVKKWVNPANKWARLGSIWVERVESEVCWMCKGSGKWEDTSPDYYSVEEFPLDPEPGERVD